MTADTRGAGTDAKVTLWVTDINGKVIGPMLVREEGNLYNDFFLKKSSLDFEIFLR